MSMDLKELYQELILDHNRNPRNHYQLQDANAQARGFNPICGDKITLFLHIENDQIKAISFLGQGCAISQASASLMTEALQGKSIEEAHKLFHHVHMALTSEENKYSIAHHKLMVLEGVRAYPARVKCATLAWHTLEAALNKMPTIVSTE